VIFLKEIIKSGGKRKTFYLSNTGLFVCGCFTQEGLRGFVHVHSNSVHVLFFKNTGYTQEKKTRTGKIKSCADSWKYRFYAYICSPFMSYE
jgi:hypothetical protein